MLCPKCGVENDEGATSCSNCKQELSRRACLPEDKWLEKKTIGSTQESNKLSKRGRIILSVCVVAFLLIFLVLWFFVFTPCVN